MVSTALVTSMRLRSTVPTADGASLCFFRRGHDAIQAGFAEAVVLVEDGNVFQAE
jgi:hypothetical protein